MHGARRCIVAITTMLMQRCALDLAGMIEHGTARRSRARQSQTCNGSE
jgi:hypothetical protein